MASRHRPSWMWKCRQAGITASLMHRLIDVIENAPHHSNYIFQRGLGLYLRAKYHRTDHCTECSHIAEGIQPLIAMAEKHTHRDYSKGDKSLNGNQVKVKEKE